MSPPEFRVMRVLQAGATEEGDFAVLDLEDADGETVRVCFGPEIASAASIAMLTANSVLERKRSQKLGGSAVAATMAPPKTPKIETFSLGAGFRADGGRELFLRFRLRNGANIDVSLGAEMAEELAEEIPKVLRASPPRAN